MTKENVNNFCNNLYDTKYLCDFNNIDLEVPEKCGIYHLLINNKIITQEKLEEGNDGLDYFINNFGEKETYKMVMDNNLIDIDEASRDAVQSDGIAHFIASYDRITLYLLNNNVAYRNN